MSTLGTSTGRHGSCSLNTINWGASSPGSGPRFANAISFPCIGLAGVYSSFATTTCRMRVKCWSLLRTTRYDAAASGVVFTFVFFRAGPLRAESLSSVLWDVASSSSIVSDSSTETSSAWVSDAETPSPRFGLVFFSLPFSPFVRAQEARNWSSPSSRTKLSINRSSSSFRSRRSFPFFSFFPFTACFIVRFLVGDFLDVSPSCSDFSADDLPAVPSSSSDGTPSDSVRVLVDDGSVAFFALLWRTPRLLLLTLGNLFGYVFAVAFPPALERVVPLPGLGAMVVPVGAVMLFYSN